MTDASDKRGDDGFGELLGGGGAAQVAGFVFAFALETVISNQRSVISKRLLQATLVPTLYVEILRFAQDDTCFLDIKL